MEKNKKYLMIWADSGLSTKSNHVNAPYHFIHMGEIINYLNKNLKNKVEMLDIEATQIEFPIFMRKIIQNKYDAISFYINTENIQNSLKLLDFIKIINPGCMTVAYGELPLYLPGYFKKTKFDAIVDRNCDQESSLLDFFKYSSNMITRESLHGLSLINNNSLIKTNPGLFIKPEEWGFSVDSETPINDYFKMEGKNQYVMTLSRGCPYNCKYCNATMYYGLSERRRPVNKIVNFIDNHDYEYYKFFAPNFTLNKEEAYNICNSLIKCSKKIKWSCTTRPDLINDEELISLMAKSGCYKIAIGVESVSKKDLENVNKRYEIEQVSKGVELLNKYNIEYKALIMFGMPNQTIKDIKYTISFFNKLNIKLRPTAFTPFYEMKSSFTASQISKYDKRTFYKGIPGLSYANFLRLVYDIDEYKKYLKEGEDNV